jgi:hypothetical protein
VLIPLYGFLAGDTLGLIVLVHDHQTVAELAACLVQASSVRVAPREGLRVFAGERCLDPQLTLVQAGLTALSRVDVRP